ncbi:MAG: preprotein translocase subunit SecG [Candidatus Sericytochromatia bacterium]
MQTALTWFQLLLSLALIVAIIIHPAKGMGLGSMGGSAQIFGSQKGAEAGLNRFTGTIAFLWAAVALLLSSSLIK